MTTYIETPQHNLNRKIGYRLQRKEQDLQQALLIRINDNTDLETETVSIEVNGVEMDIKADTIYNYLTEWECISFDNDDEFEIKLLILDECEELAYTAYKAWYYKALKAMLCK